MKYSTLLFSLLIATPLTYGLNVELHKAFEEENFLTCYTLINDTLGIEDKNSMIKKVDAALEQIYANYNPIFFQDKEKDLNFFSAIQLSTILLKSSLIVSTLLGWSFYFFRPTYTNLIKQCRNTLDNALNIPQVDYSANSRINLAVANEKVQIDSFEKVVTNTL